MLAGPLILQWQAERRMVKGGLLATERRSLAAHDLFRGTQIVSVSVPYRDRLDSEGPRKMEKRFSFSPVDSKRKGG